RCAGWRSFALLSEAWRSQQRGLREVLRARGRPGEAASEGAASALEPDAALASVVVVCWNAQAVVGRCLEQLLEQDYPNFELIVVDDGSTDGTLAVAEAAAATGALKLVRGGRNRGCPAARNIGLRHARGELVAFVDADGFAAPDWLRRVVASFEQDRGIGGVASTVFYADNPLVLNGAGGTVNRQGWAADLSMNESYEDAELATEALYPMGCGMAFTREALERVGAFDERMVNYYDDVDYGIRVWRAGYRVRVVLKHAPARSLTRWAAGELRSLREAPKALRRQKLAAIAWNALHLPSALAARRRQRGVPHSPARLVDDSWGDAFPAGVPERSTPVPEHAGARAAMDDPGG